MPPPPFNQSYSIIVITGGSVYGRLNSTTTPLLEDPCAAEQLDVVIAGGKILRLMNRSNTDAFIAAMRNSQISVLSISAAGHVIIPGLIDVHVHAIGGGGEQGQFVSSTHSSISFAW